MFRWMLARLLRPFGGGGAVARPAVDGRLLRVPAAVRLLRVPAAVRVVVVGKEGGI